MFRRSPKFALPEGGTPINPALIVLEHQQSYYNYFTLADTFSFGPKLLPADGAIPGLLDPGDMGSDLDLGASIHSLDDALRHGVPQPLKPLDLVVEAKDVFEFGLGHESCAGATEDYEFHDRSECGSEAKALGVSDGHCG